MRGPKNKLHMSLPIKAQSNQLNSNHSVQKSKQENGKSSIHSSASNIVLLRKAPIKKVSSENQKAIDNDITNVEMKINQTTEDSINKDSRCQFQRETENLSILNNLRVTGEEHINQIININIYNNMNINDSIKTCSDRNPITEREDSFIQNISIGDAKQTQIKSNQNNPFGTTILTMHEDGINDINDIDIIEAIDVGKKSGKRSNRVDRNKKMDNDEHTGNNSINNDINNIAKEHGLQQDKKNLITNTENDKQSSNKRKVMKYIIIGISVMIIIAIIGIFVYIFKKT